ncbi:MULTISPECIES: pseudaminic acid synthase [Synergistaceae]|uniref:pseudaminic acid synthase n=1 Tax=Synergistaceae TaxID=649777 RepID=UPI003AECBAAB|nr:pseudaminic acid synthase [Synergistaceae bacterium DZ-S4]
MNIDFFDTSNKVFIIAELSANHGHDIAIAKKTIDAVKDSGADAIKLQTYRADTLTIDCNNDYFKLDIGTIWDGRTLYDLYSEAYTPWEWHEELMDYANRLGLIFFSSPFDKTAADFLEGLNVPAYKIASFELMDIPLIEYIASKGKPMIMSTGVASLSEICDAVVSCRRMNNNQIMLMKCTSSYPAKVEDANLLMIPNMKETFEVEVGLSDHTLGITAPIVSIVLGARAIEKHFILDKSIGGPDSSFSLEPDEFKKMVDSVREAEKALGKINYNLESTQKNRLIGRSLFVVEDVEEGEIFTENNIRSIRPGYGLPPKYIKNILGKKAKNNIKRGTPLNWDLIT